MSKNDNYIYPILVMSNDIIFRGAGGQKLWGKQKVTPSSLYPTQKP